MLLSVFNLLQTVLSKARVARELASQLYSDVKGSNPIHRIHKWVDWRPDMVTSRRFRRHIFEGGKEKMNDQRAENHIPGSSLSGRRSSVLKK